LLATKGEYVITHSDQDVPLTSITEYCQSSALAAVTRLEHIARWIRIRDLSNASSRIPSDAVQVSIRIGEVESDRLDVHMEYLYENGEWIQPHLTVRLLNTGSKRLYLTLLALSERFAVHPGFFAAGGIWLGEREESFASVYGTVPDDLWAQGMTQARDILKVIVSDEEFDARSLRQDRLETDLACESSSGTRGRHTLDRVLNHFTSRELSSAGEAPERADWRTSTISITTVRPRPGESARSST
jgi:hypothetical protein